jgi:molybdate transport system substrate-binding protein
MKKTLAVLIVIVLLISTGCTKEENKTSVYAAASLTEVLDKYNNLIDNRMNLNFDSSTRLRIQIENGAEPHIYLSANKKNIDILKEKDLIIESKEILKNRMVIITPKDSSVESPLDLTGNIKLVIAEEEVPCGRYALEVLDNYNLKYGKDYSGKVLNNVVSRELNVKLVVSKITMGEADAGIVYITDINENNKEKINIIEIEPEFNINASYWICRIRDENESKKFYKSFLEDENMKSIFENYGFKVVY